MNNYAFSKSKAAVLVHAGPLQVPFHNLFTLLEWSWCSLACLAYPCTLSRPIYSLRLKLVLSCMLDLSKYPFKTYLLSTSPSTLSRHIYSPRLKLVYSCILDLSKYPFKTCLLPQTEAGDLVHARPLHVPFQSLFTLPDWSWCSRACSTSPCTLSQPI